MNEEHDAREWIEMAWAARNAASPALNGARRAWFDGVKELLRAGEPVRAVHINFNRKRTL
jgi:hypothetical protein